jgi:hypothetical protein
MHVRIDIDQNKAPRHVASWSLPVNRRFDGAIAARVAAHPIEFILDAAQSLSEKSQARRSDEYRRAHEQGVPA